MDYLSQLSQKPVVDAILPNLDSESMKSFGMVNKKISLIKNQYVKHLEIKGNPYNQIQLNLKKYPNLKSIDIQDLDEHSLPNLKDYPNIKMLRLEGYFFYFSLNKFKADFFQNIEELDLSKSVFLDNCLTYLKKMPTLRVLNLSGYSTYRYHKILQIILTLPKLECLIMQKIPNRLPLEPFQKYLKNSHLKVLDIRQSQFFPGIKSIFGQCPNIMIKT
jgi:hypothetical protein